MSKEADNQTLRLFNEIVFGAPVRLELFNTDYAEAEKMAKAYSIEVLSGKNEKLKAILDKYMSSGISSLDAKVATYDYIDSFENFEKAFEQFNREL